MAGPPLARFTTVAGKRVRVYDVDDRALPSVTTVISGLAKPGLEKWLQKNIATAAVQTSEWRTFTDDEETAIDMIMAASKYVGRTAAARGTDVHAAIETRQPSGLIPEHLRPYVAAGYEVERRLEEAGYEHLESEITLANLQVGYAGTADQIWRRPNRDGFAILDWKTTSSTAGWREAQLQLAALSRCDVKVEADGALYPTVGEFTELIVVALKPDGTADVRRMTKPATIGALYRVFRGLVELFNLDETLPYLKAWDHSEEGITPR